MMTKSNDRLMVMAEQIAKLRNEQVKRRQAHLLCNALIAKLQRKEK